MTPQAVIDYFGSAAATARALGLRSHASILKWLALGAVPAPRQAQIEEVTGGALRASVKPWEDAHGTGSDKA